MGTPRRVSSSSGVGEDFLEEGMGRAEGLADIFSELLPAITKKSRRPSLVLGKLSCFQKEKKDKILEIDTNWLWSTPEKLWKRL